jgi:rhamnose utilization protein RhaD (predicted bifunctional aldolase and dehydrogenase)
MTCGYLQQAISEYRERAIRRTTSAVPGPQDPAMRDPNPVVVLVPGVGRITFAADKVTARLAGEFYGNAINVMRGAEAIGGYVGLDEQEAFNIEYWALEEAKLQRMPAPSRWSGELRW